MPINTFLIAMTFDQFYSPQKTLADQRGTRMNISEVISRIQEAKSNDAIFRDSLVQHIQFIDDNTASIFFRGVPREVGITGFDENEKNTLAEFSAHYVSYLLSTFPLRGMSAAVKNCSYDSLKNWLSTTDSNGTPVYRPLFEKIAVNGYYHLGIRDFVTNLGEFEKTLTIKPFFMTHIRDRANIWVLQALLLLAKANAKESSDRILTRWKEYDAPSVASCQLDLLLDKDWIGAFLDELPAGKGIYGRIYPLIESACNRERHETETVSGGGFAGGYPVEYKEQRELVYYGEDVGHWLWSTAKQYDHYAKEPAYMGTQPPSSGCVRKGTKILMARGPARRIEDLTLHDEVLNCRQLPSYATKEPIRNLAVDRLYAVNDDAPFMSLDHPILTRRGWCAPCPEISMEMTPEFTVLPLERGDAFVKVSQEDDGTLVFTDVIIERINIAEYPDGVECYDLDFYDGYRSYYANGYPCLCNYPHITMASLKERLQDLSKEEQRTFLDFFSEHHDMLCKLIGRSAMEILDQGMLHPNQPSGSQGGLK